MVGTVQSASQEPIQSKREKLFEAYETFDRAAREYFSDKRARIEPDDSPGSSANSLFDRLDRFFQQNPGIARVASGAWNFFSQWFQPSPWQGASFMGSPWGPQGGSCWNRQPSFMDRLFSSFSSQCQGWPQRSYFGPSSWGWGGTSSFSFNLGKLLKLSIGRSRW